MKTKNYILVAMLMLSTSAMAKTTIYDNSATALNINMLSDTFLSYTERGETLSDLFKSQKLYSTMRRVDEYGDDGSTLKTDVFDDNQNSDFFIKNVWADVRHINGHTHYDNQTSNRTRFNIATLGATTKSTGLRYGDIYFGAFAGYINADSDDIDSDGAVGGIFAHYNLSKFDSTFLINIGSLNNNSGESDFNNSWTNIALDAKVRFDIDKTFIVRPGVSIAYMFVSSDDIYVNNKVVWSDDFNFWNVAPYIHFVKEIVPDWYGAFTAKYVAHFGGNNDILTWVAPKIDGIDMDNYTDLGLDIEYNFKQFVFDGQIHKQIGGLDAWSGNINVKYLF